MSLSFQARLFDEPQLASLCLDTIDKSTMDAISAEGFTDIDIGKSLCVLSMKWHYPRKVPSPIWVCRVPSTASLLGHPPLQCFSLSITPELGSTALCPCLSSAGVPGLPLWWHHTSLKPKLSLAEGCASSLRHPWLLCICNRSHTVLLPHGIYLFKVAQIRYN